MEKTGTEAGTHLAKAYRKLTSTLRGGGMPTWCRAVRCRDLAFAVVFACIASRGMAIAQERPPAGGSSKIDVELKIVPFYAVDAEGRPVFDLRREEVELRVDGAAVAVESFDRYSTAGPTASPAAERPREGSAAPAAPAVARHVFFLFDVAFSSPRGLLASSEVAKGYLDQLPAIDRLYLLLHDRRTGLKQVLGPIAANDKGKEKVLKRLRELRPDVQGLNTNAGGGLPPSIIGAASSRGRNKDVFIPPSQDSAMTDAIRSGGRAEYESVALTFADSLEALAAELRRLPGPKLLLTFTQGLDPGIYFEGNSHGLQTGRAGIRVDSRQFSALETRFRKPLQALADSGAMNLFVNLDRPLTVGDGDRALRHIASSAGGLYVESRSAKDVKDRVASSTAAYYEAGFLPAGSLLEAGRAGVEVVVNRPGVKVWSASAVRTRERYAVLSEHEKRLLVIDLVQGGPEAQRSRGPVRLDLHDLSGKVQGRVEPKRRHVRFEAAWPADLAGKKVDLYTVVLAEPRKGAPIEILLYDQKERAAVADLPAVETAIEGHNGFVWGLVAVESGTERAWFRRLLVQAAKPAGGPVR